MGTERRRDRLTRLQRVRRAASCPRPTSRLVLFADQRRRRPGHVCRLPTCDARRAQKQSWWCTSSPNGAVAPRRRLPGDAEKSPEAALSQTAGNRKPLPKSRAPRRGQQQLGFRPAGSVAGQPGGERSRREVDRVALVRSDPASRHGRGGQEDHLRPAATRFGATRSCQRLGMRPEVVTRRGPTRQDAPPPASRPTIKMTDAGRFSRSENLT